MTTPSVQPSLINLFKGDMLYNQLKCNLSAFDCKPVSYYIIGMICLLSILYIAYASGSSRIVLVVSTLCHLLIFIICSKLLIYLCQNKLSISYSYAIIAAGLLATYFTVFIFNMKKSQKIEIKLVPIEDTPVEPVEPTPEVKVEPNVEVKEAPKVEAKVEPAVVAK